MKIISVFIELYQKKVCDVSIELLNAAKQLAEECKGLVHAVIVTDEIDVSALGLDNYPIDYIVLLENQLLSEYKTDSYTYALENYVECYKPECILFGATTLGKDLAPRLAARCKTGLTAECTSVSYDAESEKILWSRAGFGGHMMADIICAQRLPQMGTIRGGVYRKPEKIEKHMAEIIHLPVKLEGDMDRVVVLQRTPKIVAPKNNSNEADIVVGVGKGISSSTGLELVMSFADAIGADIGCSRGALERRLFPEACVIGVNGRNIRPKIYIACGISGASQHMAGVKDAECIIAINKDPNAAIMQYADYAIVGDVHKILENYLSLENEN